MRNYSTLTLIRVVSRIGEFFFKAYLIRTVLSENIFGHTLNLDFILNTSLHVIRVCLKPSYQKGQNKDIVKAIKSGMNIMTFGVLTAFLLAVLAASLQLGHSGGLKYFRQSVFLYIAAAVMEGIFEKYNV